MADNPFGDDGGLSLSKVLCKENVTLRVLDIHGTRMSQQTEQRVCMICQHHMFSHNSVTCVNSTCKSYSML